MPSFPFLNDAYQFYLFNESSTKEGLHEYWGNKSRFAPVIYLLKWFPFYGCIVAILCLPGLIYLVIYYDKYEYLWFNVFTFRYVLDIWYFMIQTVLVYYLIQYCLCIIPWSILLKHVSVSKIIFIVVLFNVIIGGIPLILILYYTLNGRISKPNIFCGNWTKCDEETWHFFYMHGIYRSVFPLLSMLCYIGYINHYWILNSKISDNKYKTLDIHRVSTQSMYTSTNISENICGIVKYVVLLFIVILIYFVGIGICAFFNSHNMENKDDARNEYGYMIYFIATYFGKIILKQISRKIDGLTIMNIHLFDIDSKDCKHEMISLEYVMEYFFGIFYWIYFKQYLILHTTQTSYYHFISVELVHSVSGLCFQKYSENTYIIKIYRIIEINCENKFFVLQIIVQN